MTIPAQNVTIYCSQIQIHARRMSTMARLPLVSISQGDASKTPARGMSFRPEPITQPIRQNDHKHLRENRRPHSYATPPLGRHLRQRFWFPPPYPVTHWTLQDLGVRFIACTCGSGWRIAARVIRFLGTEDRGWCGERCVGSRRGSGWMIL